MNGWFSQEAINQGLAHSTIWLTDDGKEVEITCATNQDYNWKDKVFKGNVVKFIRQAQPKRKSNKEIQENT